MHHIEFIGLQGAGKTRLYSELLKIIKNKKNFISYEKAIYLSLKDYKRIKEEKDLIIFLKLFSYKFIRKFLSVIYSKSKKFLRELADFECSNSDLYSFTLRNIKKYGKNEEWRRDTLYGLNSFYSRYNLISKNFLNKEIIIFDEGFLQRGISIFATNPYKSPKKKDILDYINKIPLPKIVFYINSSPELCLKRMKLRKEGVRRMSRLSKKEFQKVIKNSLKYLRIVNLELKKKGVLVFVIKNKRLQESKKQLEKTINNFL